MPVASPALDVASVLAQVRTLARPISGSPVLPSAFQRAALDARIDDLLMHKGYGYVAYECHTWSPSEPPVESWEGEPSSLSETMVRCDRLNSPRSTRHFQPLASAPRYSSDIELAMDVVSALHFCGAGIIATFTAGFHALEKPFRLSSSDLSYHTALSALVALESDQRGTSGESFILKCASCGALVCRKDESSSDLLCENGHPSGMSVVPPELLKDFARVQDALKISEERNAELELRPGGVSGLLSGEVKQLDKIVTLVSQAVELRGTSPGAPSH